MLYSVEVRRLKAYDIRPRRKETGFLQTDLAKEIGVAKEVVIAVEDGRIGLDDETYAKFEEGIARLKARKEEAVTA